MGKTPAPGQKAFEAKERTNNKLTHTWRRRRQGFEPGQHWLEGSANPLLPIVGCDCSEADLGFLIGGGEKGLLHAFGV